MCNSIQEIVSICAKFDNILEQSLNIIRKSFDTFCVVDRIGKTFPDTVLLVDIG